ncbi:MAG TPA: CBS domain-containing protein [Frankiaceae bacterium]|nr:CBS domain-containing protein [Frankiaceae bacterium]
MELEHATALPVIDGATSLVGLVTDHDIVHAVARGIA